VPFLVVQGRRRIGSTNAPLWGQQRNNIPLSDFFPLPVRQPRLFTHINWVKHYTFFQNFYATTGLKATGPHTY
jgi:hypothetical protein